ncbi:MAG TPA: carbon-nitrogen hydrolase family protein [Methanoculleus sp.]|nr:carbon-nitrogen hydrolase family protein [Methanoculleus sp.]
MTVRICAAQTACAWGRPAETLDAAASAVEAAAAQGARLIAFPEQYPIGWDPFARFRVEELGGATVTALCDLARRNAVAIVAGFRERHDPLPRNTSVAIGPGGEILSTYAKVHLFSPAREHEQFSAGHDLGIFSLEGMTFGLALCYDLRFPDLFSLYAAEGAECIIVPAAWPCRRAEHWEVFVRARALENQYFLAGINTIGTTPVDRYCGRSMVAGPAGEVLARAKEGEELIFADISSASIGEARARIPLHSDRRDDLYKRLRKDM